MTLGRFGLFAGAALLAATCAHAAAPAGSDSSARIAIGRNGAPYVPGSFAPGASSASFTPDGSVPIDDASFGVGNSNADAGFGPGGPDRHRAAADGSALKLTTRVFARLPEPATWAMMILGFGVIGTIVRRRLRQSEQRFNEKIRRIAAGEGSEGASE